MPQTINTNVASLTAQRNLNQSQGTLNVSLQRLSSGLRINSAKDDAAGLGISDRFTSQIRGLDQARRNSNDGISLAQTAEGALGSAGDILQRIRELAVQSANATNSSSDRQALQNEVTQLTSELDRVAQQTEFNGLKLLDGTFTSSTFQVGANSNQTITLTSANFRTTTYGLNRIDSTATITGATAGTIQAAIGSTSHIAGGTVVLNGYLGSSTVTVATGSSAKTVAAQLNQVTSNTGVTASARTEYDVTGLGTSTSYVLQVQSTNSTAKTITFTTGSTINADGLASAVNAFNDISSQTGVTAKLNSTSTGITLTNEVGDDIRISQTTGNAGGFTFGGVALAAGSGGSATILTGQVTLDSERTFSFTDSAAAAGAILGTNAGGSTLSSVSTVDVTTFTNATKALAIVDKALAAVSNQRAKFGALQSRFETTIGNLQTTSENLSAARSRIRDADFAAETAELTRGQILQQAGTAILAQANGLPNNVLSLLRG